MVKNTVRIIHSLCDDSMRNQYKDKKAILAWCLYDWAISAFPVIVTTFVFSAYFTSKVAENTVEGTEQWGNALALSSVIIAILSPILGAVVDHAGSRKRWLFGCTLILICSAFLLWFVQANTQSIYFMLSLVIIGTIALNIGNVFYNAMLPNLTRNSQIGRISGWGWGLGYLGGLVLLLITYYGFVKHPPSWINVQTDEHIRICGPLVAGWILLFSWPLFVFVPEYSVSQMKLSRACKKSFSQLGDSLRIIINNKNLLFFFSAQMLYLDGLNTLFAFAGIYASGTFNLTMSDILLLGIMMNFCAGLGSLILAFVTDWIGAKRTILLSLIVMMTCGFGIVIVQQQIHFWILGGSLSLFVGGLQSASRTLLSRIIIKEYETLMFGFSALTGKVSAFLGPLFLGWASIQFNSQRVGMSTILIFFILGGLMITRCKEKNLNSRS